jgi:hypothetical protein
VIKDSIGIAVDSEVWRAAPFFASLGGGALVSNVIGTAENLDFG